MGHQDGTAAPAGAEQMKALVLINLVVVVAFGWFVIRAYLSTDSSVRGQYTALDRAGVINEEALAAFDENMARDSRILVPRWIAKPALSAERQNAALGLAVALVNLYAVGFVGWRMRRDVARLTGASVHADRDTLSAR
jgi:hypothetical protein